MGAMNNKLLDRASIKLGLKLLLVIMFTEALIMAAFHLLGVSPSAAWAGIADALLLGVISSIVIFLWVVKPLKQAKQQNELFNTMVNNLDVGVVVTDPHQENHPIVFVNPAFTRITGYSAEEAVGENPRIMQGDDIDASALSKTREAIRQAKGVRVLQRNRRKDGSSFWNDLHLNPIFNSAGQVQLWVGLISDVSATKALEKENQRWASALQQSDEAVCVFDVDGVIEFANEAFCNNVHLSCAEVEGKPVSTFWSPDSPALEALENCLQHTQSWNGRHKRLRPDQSSYDALSSITPIHDEQGVASFVSVHRDISAMIAIEEQLRQSQKMEAVGMLVGGIAHDFNNVLAGMLGNLYLVRSRMKGFPELKQRIENVEEQGYGAAGMVRQLLSFSRKDAPDVKAIDLVPFVKELTKFAAVSVPENIEFSCHVENTSLMTNCDPVQLQQSLLNLVVNATHAVQERMEHNADKGNIALSVSDTALPARLAQDDRSDAGNTWACIRVRDNGTGMNQATINKIFEPFFTTKPSGSGTGLGLAMVKNYVEALDGAIDVESKPGEGTCLSIYLPVTTDKLSQVDSDEQLRRGDGELILVADDNNHVLEALSSILESANYHVLQATNGEHAIQVFTDHAEDVNIAILDVVMPRATGLQAAEHMQQIRKDFPIVMMTGYDKQEALLQKEHASYPVLRKPWNLANLNDVLASSLSKHVNEASATK